MGVGVAWALCVMGVGVAWALCVMGVGVTWALCVMGVGVAWALCVMGVCVAAVLLQWQLLEDIPDQEHWVGGLPALPGRSDQVSASNS